MTPGDAGNWREACKVLGLMCPHCTNRDPRMISHDDRGYHCDVCAKDFNAPE